MRNNQRRTGQSAPSPSSPASSQANLAYVVPTEFVELPSRGLFYDVNHPLHNQETVEIKFMTAKEEDILSSMALIKNGLVIDRLLSNIIVLDVDPQSLTVGDRNAIMIAARISSYGRNYEVSLTCTACYRPSEFTFDLNNSTVTGDCFDNEYLKDNNVVFNEEQRTFDVELPQSKVKVSIQPITGEDEKSVLDADEESAVTSLLSTFVKSIDGDANAVSQFIEVMPAGDSRFLRKLYATLMPNVELKDTFVCEKCSHIKETEVPLTAEFFWPE